MAPTQKNINKNAVAEEVAEPTTAMERKSRGFSLVWVVPIIALILTGLMIWNLTINTGPEITIQTSTAEGIEAGKTLVKARSVTVGTVTHVALSPDYNSTILTVQMAKHTEELLRSDTKFWVVKPRIENTGISGLDTLLSGSYIQLMIGKKDDFANDFKALDEPPLRLGDGDGIMVSLYSDTARKLSTGDAVTFRGFDVGTIAESQLDVKTQIVHYKVFIREPYAALVNPSTKFWVSAGFEFNFDANGATFRTEPLDNLIVGGISFDNFFKDQHQRPFDPDQEYRLYEKSDDARTASLESGLLYTVMLEGNVLSIAPGSAVTYKGVKIGEVVAAPWLLNKIDLFKQNMIPVLIAIDTSDIDEKEITDILNGYLKTSTLCASVGSANLLMSNNQIDLVHDPKNKCSTTRDIFKEMGATMQDGLLSYHGHNVIPVLPAESLSSQLDAFMAKLNTFDVAGLSNELQNSMRAFAGAMDSFTQSNHDVHNSKVIEKLARAFDNFNESVKGYGPNTPIYKSINENLKNIEQILQDISPVASEIGQNPSSIIFGGQDDPVPKKSKKR